MFSVCILKPVLHQLLLRNWWVQQLGFLSSPHLRFPERKCSFYTRCISNPVFYNFSVSLWLFMAVEQGTQFSTSVSICLVVDCPLVVSSMMLPVYGSRYQLPTLPASSNTLTSCNVPFLLTSLVSVKSSQQYKFSVRCTRLQYHHALWKRFKAITII